MVETKYEIESKTTWFVLSLRYGFVTFAEVSCAYEVIDKFSKDTTISKYDIRFGGRRKFCKQNYADLGEPNIQVKFNFR